jgi:parvulin-like peptidyl-prolyl isomerase
MIRKIFNQPWLLCLCVIFFIAACDKINFLSRPYVATVNGAKIYLDEYRIRLAQKKAMLPKNILAKEQSYIKRFEEEVLDGMITEKIMNLRTQELALSISPQELEERAGEIQKEYGDEFSNMLVKEKIRYEQWKEDLRKEMLFEKLIAVDVNARVHVSEDEAEDYFNEHQEIYRMEPRIRAAQIVVRDQVRAQQVLLRLTAGEDFAKVAREVSIGPEASRGGDLGFITRQIMPEPLDETIFKLPVGKISPVVQSPYGFHIFKILEIKPAKMNNFTESKAEVMADLKAKKEEAAFAGWLETLKMKAVIKKETTVLRNEIKP